MSRYFDSIVVDDTFERAYEVDVLADLPNSKKIKVFDVARGGAILKISPHAGEPFIVTVAASVGSMRLLSWPDPMTLVVMPAATLVDLRNPEASDTMRGFEGHSVHYLMPFPKQEVVLIGHCCGIYCYESTGLRWSHEDLFCCEDPVVDISGDDVILFAHKHGDDPGEEPVRKIVSLATGERRC